MADDAAAPAGSLKDLPSTGIAPSVPADEDIGDTADFDAEALDDSSGDDHAGRSGRGSLSTTGQALIVGVVAVVALAALCGWLGFRAHESHHAQQRRDSFLEAGRQGAINLTTIDFVDADTDVQRILDSATGTFFDDFSKRSQPFVDVVKQTRSTSVGTVTAAGIESETDDGAQVLVAVSVKTSNAGGDDQQPRAWRMRVSVQSVGELPKVSNVEFVP